MRMEQYIQMIDYSVWEVIENGNSPPITQVVKGVKTTIAPATVEEKAPRRFEFKARSTLLMGIPNEHQLKFKSIKDAKSLLQAVEKRFGGNAATRMTKRNLLKKEYENFTASSSKVLDQTFDRLQKLISQLEIHGESISQKDVNHKRDRFKVADGFANNESKEILEEYWKEVFYEWECKAPRSQDSKHNESTRRIVPMETPASAALVSCDGLGYNDVPTPYTGNFLPPKPYLFGLQEFVNESIVSEPAAKKHAVNTSEAKASENKPKVVRKNFGPPLIKDWISDSEDEAESKYKIEKKTVKPCFAKIKFVKSKEQVKSPRKTAVMQGKFDGKANERFFIEYSLDNKAFRIFKNRTRIVEENLHISNDGKKVDEDPRQKSECKDQAKEDNVNNTNNVNAASTNRVNVVGANTNNELPFDPKMPALEDINIFNFFSDHEDVDEEADMNNMDTSIQMDVKSAFLYGKIKQEVHVCQPPGFEDPDFPDKVYKVKKALFKLHQAPRACQDKYVAEILKKYGFLEVNNANTPMETQKTLLKDEDGEEVDVYMYRSMIGSLMYLTSSRPDIMFVYPKDSPFDLVAYIDSDYARASLDRKSTTGGCQFLRCRLISWQCKKQTVVVNFTTEAEYVAASSCYGQYALTVNPTVYTSCIEQFWATVKAKIVNEEGQLLALVDGKKIIITESTIRRDLQLEDAEGVDCLPNAIIFEQLTLIRIHVTPSHKKKIFRNMKRVGKGFSRRDTPLFHTMMVQVQEDMCEGSTNPTNPHYTPTITQPSTSQPQRLRKTKRKDIELPQTSVPTSVANEDVNEEMDDSLEKTSTTITSLNVEQDRGVNTPRRGNDSLELTELMKLCTKLQQRVLYLETTKTSQAMEIESLKKREKKLKRKKRSRTSRLKRLYKVGLSASVESSEDEGLGEEYASKQGRIADIDSNQDLYLVNVHKDEDMFGLNNSDGDEVSAVDEANVVSTATTTTATIDDITLAKALMEIKSAKPKATAASTRPKAKRLVIHKREQAPIPIVSLQQPSQVTDKGKGKMVEPEPVKKLSKKNQLMLDEELAFKLKAKEEERLAREKAQQIKEVNTFVDFRTELVEESSKKARAEIAQECSLKRAGEELKKENAKKQKMEDEKESEELKLGYSAVTPPIAQLYSSPKKDLSWTGLLECVDDTITDYSRPSPVVESTPNHLQNSSPSASETGALDSILSKHAVKFVKATERPTTDKVETAKKLAVRYAKLYRKTTKRSTVMGNQRNWNNLKSQQIGTELEDSVRTKRSRVMSSHCQKKFPLLEEIPTTRVILPLVLSKLDWSTKSQIENNQKSVSFIDGSDSNTYNSRFMEKLKAMDSQIISLNEELQDMREKYNELRNVNASKNHLNDDTLMCEHLEANYIQLEGLMMEGRGSRGSGGGGYGLQVNGRKEGMYSGFLNVREDRGAFLAYLHNWCLWLTRTCSVNPCACGAYLRIHTPDRVVKPNKSI
uniref:Ribonuclease H-like domain, reverse transcriptase, RNA-dependent DNA polymerase n=1 Tax=Tanacetum cinerariifolium TaxID=118510 RepID=A0A6L2LRD4_TANCI|nr:ribonuclease H-like domain, reverse transcriptase, RNA-dependent DNA polymerase [Tanacetum cinerariifolium]